MQSPLWKLTALVGVIGIGAMVVTHAQQSLLQPESADTAEAFDPLADATSLGAVASADPASESQLPGQVEPEPTPVVVPKTVADATATEPRNAAAAGLSFLFSQQEPDAAEPVSMNVPDAAEAIQAAWQGDVSSDKISKVAHATVESVVDDAEQLWNPDTEANTADHDPFSAVTDVAEGVDAVTDAAAGLRREVEQPGAPGLLPVPREIKPIELASAVDSPVDGAIVQAAGTDGEPEPLATALFDAAEELVPPARVRERVVADPDSEPTFPQTEPLPAGPPAGLFGDEPLPTANDPFPIAAPSIASESLPGDAGQGVFPDSQETVIPPRDRPAPASFPSGGEPEIADPFGPADGPVTGAQADVLPPNLTEPNATANEPFFPSFEPTFSDSVPQPEFQPDPTPAAEPVRPARTRPAPTVAPENSEDLFNPEPLVTPTPADSTLPVSAQPATSIPGFAPQPVTGGDPLGGPAFPLPPQVEQPVPSGPFPTTGTEPVEVTPPPAAPPRSRERVLQDPNLNQPGPATTPAAIDPTRFIPGEPTPTQPIGSAPNNSTFDPAGTQFRSQETPTITPLPVGGNSSTPATGSQFQPQPNFQPQYEPQPQFNPQIVPSRPAITDEQPIRPRTSIPATTPALGNSLPSFPAQDSLPANPNPINSSPSYSVPQFPANGTGTAPQGQPRPAGNVAQPGDASLFGNGVVDASSPAGPQQPELQIEKDAPPKAVLNEPLVYNIRVRNVGRTAAHQVTIEDKIPKGSVLRGTIPEAEQDPRDKHLIWQLGTLQPGEERLIRVQIVPTEPGEIGSVATVRFVGRVASRTVITSPQLKLQMNGPTESAVGENLTYRYRITNQGDGDAVNVVLQNVIPAVFKHPAGNDLEYEVGTLRPGESRDVDLPVSAITAGQAVSTAVVTTSGREQDRIDTEVVVLASRLALERTGPARRFVGRPATYITQVTNTSSQPLTNVTVVETLPQGMELGAVPDHGHYDPTRRTITWTIPNLEPRGTTGFKSALVTSDAGNYATQIQAWDAAGNRATVNSQLEIAGFASLKVDVSQLTRGGGEVAVGEQVSLRMIVRNRGSAAANEVVTQFEIPPELEFVAAKPETYTLEGRIIRFESIPNLAVDGEQVIDIVCTARQPGTPRIAASVGSREQNPIRQEEAVVVFREEP
ncbi:MAG: hypothetical protein R3B90_06045 [Planctomycetaceae bacterium]